MYDNHKSRGLAVQIACALPAHLWTTLVMSNKDVYYARDGAFRLPMCLRLDSCRERERERERGILQIPLVRYVAYIIYVSFRVFCCLQPMDGMRRWCGCRKRFAS